ncbi:unnamed protein product [Boreogadus saida]
MRTCLVNYVRGVGCSMLRVRVCGNPSTATYQVVGYTERLCVCVARLTSALNGLDFPPSHVSYNSTTGEDVLLNQGIGPGKVGRPSLPPFQQLKKAKTHSCWIRRNSSRRTIKRGKARHRSPSHSTKTPRFRTLFFFSLHILVDDNRPCMDVIWGVDKAVTLTCL